MEYYYEVVIADNRYHSDKPLTYKSEQDLGIHELVSIPIQNRTVSGFVLKKVTKPKFKLRDIKAASGVTLPAHSILLANWLAEYYGCGLGEAMRQFAPSATINKLKKEVLVDPGEVLLGLENKPNKEQLAAIHKIQNSPTGTVLLHGDTGTGKTRVYLELAKQTLSAGKSVIMLTPEILLTSQLATAAKNYLSSPVYVLHSQLTGSARRKLWLEIAGAKVPVIVIGARSALFSPVQNPGLIVLDEAHEPAYKQDQTPRYHANRVASQLAVLCGAKVVLGTATPSVVDYYLAQKHSAVVTMTRPATKTHSHSVDKILVDLTDPANFSTIPYVSRELHSAIDDALSKKQQIMIYLNRRGSARLTLCTKCGWQLLCPNCDIPMVYHGDTHKSVCHTCGNSTEPPANCPSCGSPEIIYKSAGTKALADLLKNAYPHCAIKRFDSDSQKGETVNELYKSLKNGQIDILVGTQLLAKGLDLPKLGLVGIIAADTSLNLPDFSASERTFQLLYQVIGRVGRGHTSAKAVVQTYSPGNPSIAAAVGKNWPKFYASELEQRKQFNYPPFAYMLKLVCRRSSLDGAKNAALKLADNLKQAKLPIEVIGPTPSFISRRGNTHYWQLVVKSKRRSDLQKIVSNLNGNWSIDLDPIDLL